MKSRAWIKNEFKDGFYIDLLYQALYQEYLRAPANFKDIICANEIKCQETKIKGSQ